jgi:N-acetylglucosamine kinase-like BadF-type ATPase
MRKSTWIGIDVGGTKTRLDLFNDALEIIAEL